jgi:hypothetical protein
MWIAYGKFFKAARGEITVPALILALTLAQAAQVVSTYTLVWWQEDAFNKSQSVYVCSVASVLAFFADSYAQMGMYAGIGIGTAIFTFFMGLAAVRQAIKSGDAGLNGCTGHPRQQCVEQSARWGHPRRHARALQLLRHDAYRPHHDALQQRH